MISKNAFYFSSISNSQITNYRQNEKQNCHQVKDNINQFSFLVDLDHESDAWQIKAKVKTIPSTAFCTRSSPPFSS